MSVSTLLSTPNRILDSVEKHAGKLGAAYGLYAWTRELNPAETFVGVCSNEFIKPFTDKPMHVHLPNIDEAVANTIGNGAGSVTFKASLVTALIAWGIGTIDIHPMVNKGVHALERAMTKAAFTTGLLGIWMSCTHSDGAEQKMAINNAGMYPQQDYSRYTGVNRSATNGSSENVFGRT